MATSEIEKLERRYAENPHGLTFAPLAEVHRKTGDIARALELLTAGLELHPNYIPASIVLGRCHQDLGDLPSAEAAFAHVLSLDDENVIALKSLADINERLDRFGEAEGWLSRLVAVDRSNDEAREQLRRLEARKKDAEAAGGLAAASAPTLEAIDLEPVRAPESVARAAADAEAAGRADLLPADIVALELSRSATEPADSEPELAGSTRPAHQDTGAGPAESQAPAAAQPEVEEPASDEEPVGPVAGLISAEFVPPLEAIGGLDVETSDDVVLEVSGQTEFRVPDASEDFKALADRLSAPPPPPRLPEVQKTVATKAPAAEEHIIGLPASQRSYLARETRGRSVASFFHALLAARPPADGGLSGTGGPPKSPGGEQNSPGSPAVPGADQKPDDTVSFDDFFGAEREGSMPLSQRADPGKDDLDQFQTWLQNLKR
jgi:tetratricopeptide (TPR) repeat protein